jgi:branched-chain amino acid transport system substrate-binding protein
MHVATGSPVTVGWINAQGGQAINVPQYTQAAEATVDYINEYMDGLHGHKMVLDECFDLGDGASIPSCANKFVQHHDVAVIEGTLTTESTGVPIVTKAGIPWVGDILESTELKASGVFAPDSQDLSLLGAQMAYAKRLQAKDVLVISYNIPALTSVISQIYSPLAKAIGAKLSTVLEPLSQADPTPTVTAAIQQDHPGLVIVEGTQQFCQQVVPIVKSASSTSIPVYGNSLCSVPAAIKSLGSSATGLMAQSAYFTSLNSAPAQLYRAIMAKWAPSVPVTSYYDGYIFPMAFARAVNAYAKSGTITAAYAMTAMQSAANVPVPLEGGTFTCNGKVVPAFPGACATNSYEAEIDSTGNFADVQGIDPTNLLAQIPS